MNLEVVALPLLADVRSVAHGTSRTPLPLGLPRRPVRRKLHEATACFVVYFEIAWQRGLAHRMMNDFEDLFPRAQAFDPQALAALHDQLYPDVYRYIAYRLGDGPLSQDLASEVFLRLLEALRAKRVSTANLRGWLYATAHHLVMDALRQKYRRPTQELHENQHVTTRNPEQTIEDGQRLEAVQRAMQHLTPEQQHVLSLRFSQELSLEEVAAIMGKSVNAVKVLQFRALAALRRWLQREGL